MAEYEYVGDGRPDGTIVIQSGEKGAFFGATPVAQIADAQQATITATWVTISDGAQGFGFQTSDQIISVIAVIKHMQYVLKTLGMWKGSA